MDAHLRWQLAGSGDRRTTRTRRTSNSPLASRGARCCDRYSRFSLQACVGFRCSIPGGASLCVVAAPAAGGRCLALTARKLAALQPRQQRPAPKRRAQVTTCRQQARHRGHWHWQSPSLALNKKKLASEDQPSSDTEFQITARVPRSPVLQPSPNPRRPPCSGCTILWRAECNGGMSPAHAPQMRQRPTIGVGPLRVNNVSACTANLPSADGPSMAQGPKLCS